MRQIEFICVVSLAKLRRRQVQRIGLSVPPSFDGPWQKTKKKPSRTSAHRDSASSWFPNNSLFGSHSPDDYIYFVWWCYKYVCVLFKHTHIHRHHARRWLIILHFAIFTGPTVQWKGFKWRLYAVRSTVKYKRPLLWVRVNNITNRIVMLASLHTQTKTHQTPQFSRLMIVCCVVLFSSFGEEHLLCIESRSAWLDRQGAKCCKVQRTKDSRCGCGVLGVRCGAATEPRGSSQREANVLGECTHMMVPRSICSIGLCVFIEHNTHSAPVPLSVECAVCHTYIVYGRLMCNATWYQYWLCANTMMWPATTRVLRQSGVWDEDLYGVRLWFRESLARKASSFHVCVCMCVYGVCMRYLTHSKSFLVCRPLRKRLRDEKVLYGELSLHQNQLLCDTWWIYTSTHGRAFGGDLERVEI